MSLKKGSEFLTIYYFCSTYNGTQLLSNPYRMHSGKWFGRPCVPFKLLSYLLAWQSLFMHLSFMFSLSLYNAVHILIDLVAKSSARNQTQ